jgi:hypothetical protein
LVPVPVFLMKLTLKMFGWIIKTFSVEQLNFLSEGKVFSYSEAGKFGFSPMKFEEGLAVVTLATDLNRKKEGDKA